MRYLLVSVIAASVTAWGQSPADAQKQQLLDDLIARNFEQNHRRVESAQLTAVFERVLSRLFVGKAWQATAFHSVVDTDRDVTPIGSHLYVSDRLLRDVRDDDELAGAFAVAISMPRVPTGGDYSTNFDCHAEARPTGLRDVCFYNDAKADAAAMELMGRAGVDPYALIRLLRRQGQTKRVALLEQKWTAPAAAAPPPQTSECEVIQGVLDELNGKRPKPTLLR